MKPASCTRCSDVLRRKFESHGIAVIPDIKCKSPAEGVLIKESDPVSIAVELAGNGAPMISVVTEKHHYGGSVRLLEQIAVKVNVPVLRKDFITYADQLKESVDIGASGVLLIASKLEHRTLFELFEASLMLGIEPLVEIHSIEDIKMIEALKLTFVGINNRNILELETDDGTVGNTELLARYLPGDALLVSESSISCREDVRRAAAAGAKAVLAGTAILKAPDPSAMYRLLADAVF